MSVTRQRRRPSFHDSNSSPSGRSSLALISSHVTLLRTFVLILLAEMGDKTQLLTLAFAAKLQVRHVLGGVLIGTLANHALAVAFGGAALLIIPVAWVKLGAGLSFIGLGVSTMKATPSR